MATLWSLARKVAARPLSKSSWSHRYLSAGAVRSLSTTQRSLGNIVKSPFPDVEQPQGNLFNHVFEHAHRYGPTVALECSETGRKFTYNQLLEYISKFAGFLRQVGLSKGDVIALYMPNCPEYEIAKFGALSQGIVVTLVNNNYTADELARQLKDSKAQLLVSTPSLESSVSSCQILHKCPLKIIMAGPSNLLGAFNLDKILEDPDIPFADPVQVDNRDLALMPYSSGTTGPPKGVAISHGAISINVNMYANPSIFAGTYASGNFQNTYMALLPLFHIYGVVVIATVGFRTGAKVVTVPTFNPQLFLNAMKKHRFDVLHLVPPLLNFLAKSPEAKKEDLSSVTGIVVGAAPVSETSARIFKEKFGEHIFIQEGYGMTELLITNAVPRGSDRIGASGQFLPNVQGKIIDSATGADLPPDQTGEVCIKSPGMMNSYFQNEAATSSTIDSEGWLHTGDVGFIDDEGYLKVVDRTKELIKVKALQVSPSELEDILRKHPQVLDVGVVGVPHDRFGEAPRAYIVRKGDVGADDIHKFLEDKVAPHKQLAGGITFVQELPKTGTGKLLRRQLKDMIPESR